MIRRLALALILLCEHAAYADEMSAEKMTAFAEHLFEQGDYYRAITEYERVLFHFPDHSSARAARFQIAHAYLKGEKYDQAIERFRAISRDLPDDEAGKKAAFMIGEVYYQKREYSRAADVFSTFAENHPQGAEADAARVKVGWTDLRQGKWSEAAEEMRKLPADSVFSAQTASFIEDAQLYPGIRKKSPGVAGMLSAIVPGAGQLYINRPGDAAISFLLNGAFIWATTESFHKGNNATGGILLFFETGWYLGNIYNAVSGAHKYNRASEQQYMNKLQERYAITCFTDGKGGSKVGLVFRF